MVYLNAKEDQEVRRLLDKCTEHLGESFNRDLITVAELVDLATDFIDKIEEVKEKLKNLQTEFNEYKEYSTLNRSYYE